MEEGRKSYTRHNYKHYQWDQSMVVHVIVITSTSWTLLVTSAKVSQNQIALTWLAMTWLDNGLNQTNINLPTTISNSQNTNWLFSISIMLSPGILRSKRGELVREGCLHCRAVFTIRLGLHGYCKSVFTLATGFGNNDTLDRSCCIYSQCWFKMCLVLINTKAIFQCILDVNISQQVLKHTLNVKNINS